MRIGRYISHMNVSLLISVEMSQSTESSMKIMHDILDSKIIKHASMDYENWLHFAEADIKIITSNVICHLSQNQSEDDQSHLFIIIEASKILPTISITSAAGRENLLHDWRKPITESSFVTDIIVPRETITHNVSVIYCSSISDKT